MPVDYFKKYGDSSGGSLNDVCEAYRLATRKNSISVISLQQKHKIISPDHLLAEIDRHHHEDCECGLKQSITRRLLEKSAIPVFQQSSIASSLQMLS